MYRREEQTLFHAATMDLSSKHKKLNTGKRLNKWLLSSLPGEILEATGHRRGGVFGTRGNQNIRSTDVSPSFGGGKLRVKFLNERDMLERADCVD